MTAGMGKCRPDLRARRESLFRSRAAFARACGVSAETVKAWEKAEWMPSADHRPIVARALQWSLHRLEEALNHVVDDAQSPLVPNTPEHAVGSPLPAETWARSADVAQVLTMLTEQWHVLVQADNLVGPSYALAGLQQQLPLLRALLKHAPKEMRCQVLRLAAQYAESASWLYEDLNDRGKARVWADQALQLAREGEHADLVTWGYYRRAQQTLMLPSAGTHVDSHSAHQSLQQLDLAFGEGRPKPSMRAALHAQLATAFASMGESRSAHRMLDQAEDYALIHDGGDARAGHGAFATPNWVLIQRAQCWMILGRPNKAVSLYEEGLRSLPKVYQRDRGLHLIRYAHALSVAGHIDRAATEARRAWDIASAVSSRRCAKQVQMFARAVSAKHSKVAEVAELLSAVQEGC